MSSLKRILSSRANGARSRGPVTPAGKQASSLNAVRHGLLAKCVVLPTESRVGFDILLDQHIQRFSPIDDVELGVIEEMVASLWRLRRTWAIETRLHADAINAQEPGDEIGRLAAAFTALAASPQLGLLHRYEARLHHMRQRALENIYLLRSTQLANEPAFDPPSPDSAADPTPATPTAPATPATPAPAPTPSKLAPPPLPNEPSFTPATPEEPLLPSGRLYLVITRGEAAASDEPQPAEPQAPLPQLPDAILPAPAQCPLPSPGTPDQRQSAGRDCGAPAPTTTNRLPARTPSAGKSRPAIAISRLGHRPEPPPGPIRHHTQRGLAVLRLLDPGRSASTGLLRTRRRRRPPQYSSGISHNCRRNLNPRRTPLDRLDLSGTEGISLTAWPARTHIPVLSSRFL